MPPLIFAHGQPDPLTTRDMGAHPTRGPGVHPRVGEPHGSAGGDGPAVAGAGAADLAHLVAPTVERPAQALGKRPRREPTGHRPGGQPGHEGQARALVPEEVVDIVVPVKPERCHRCQYTLQGEDPQPQRHQVTELPPIKPVVTEYQLHRLVCPACGAATRAELPAGVPTGGPPTLAA